MRLFTSSADDARPGDASGDGFRPPDAYPQVDRFLVPDGGCPSGMAQCGPECVDLHSDHHHCGTCNNPCDPGLSCVAGLCSCIAGGLCTGCCAGTGCIPLGQQDVAHCGAFGQSCASCDDQLPCTTDVCLTNGKCIHKLQPDHCLIAGTCYKAGQVNPSDACRRCEPNASTSDWTPGTGCVTTLAGSTSGYQDGPAATALFFAPAGVAVLDTPGGVEVYVADRANHRIRLISHGQVTTLAGSGVDGHADGPAASAAFAAPESVVVVTPASGLTPVVYVADAKNHCIRKIANGQVATVAGSPAVSGFKDGPAAQFSSPSGIAVDSQGNIYVADLGNNRVRKISNGVVATVAGAGAPGSLDGPLVNATFYMPVDIALRLNVVGSVLVVAEMANNKLREVDVGAGNVTTVAGAGPTGWLDGSALKAMFYNPEGIAVAPNGTIYVADSGNYRLRRVALGQVTTLTGSNPGYKDGDLATALFGDPTSVALDAKGRIYVADKTNNRIRMVIP